MIKLHPSPISLSQEDFIACYGGVYEHSPWIAAGAYKKIRSHKNVSKKQNLDEYETARGLHQCLKTIVEAAPDEQKLDLLRAHPELVGKLALKDELTSHSKEEQTGAGLQDCSSDEMQQFVDLNNQYNEKMGFPFIIAVKGLNRKEILQEFSNRVNNNRDHEFKTALEQVHKIAYLRIAATMVSE